MSRLLWVWEDGYCWDDEEDEIEDPPTEGELIEWTEPEGDPFTPSSEAG